MPVRPVRDRAVGTRLGGLRRLFPWGAPHTFATAASSDESVRALGAHGLWAACGRALGVDGASRTANGELLRPAFVQVGRVAGIATPELLHASGASTSAYQRARHAEVPEPVTRAVRLQVALAHVARELPPHQRKVPERAPSVVHRKRR